MTPLEKACQVFWDEADIGLRRWDETGDTIKGEIRAAMQKTLLALAECELPDDLVSHALKNSASKFPEGHFVGVREGYRIEFRAMLRSIANEGKDSG